MRRAWVALLCALSIGCARPIVYRARPEPPVVSEAVLWTFARIARAPHAYFQFHLRLDPPAPCGELEWEWGDGRSVQESECTPDELGPTVYSAWHVYRRPGEYEVTARLALRGRVIVRASTHVIVQPGLGQ